MYISECSANYSTTYNCSFTPKNFLFIHHYSRQKNKCLLFVGVDLVTFLKAHSHPYTLDTIVASSNASYYLGKQLYVKRSQYIRIENSLYKQTKKHACASKQDVLDLATL